MVFIITSVYNKLLTVYIRSLPVLALYETSSQTSNPKILKFGDISISTFFSILFSDFVKPSTVLTRSMWSIATNFISRYFSSSGVTSSFSQTWSLDMASIFRENKCLCKLLLRSQLWHLEIRPLPFLVIITNIHNFNVF